MGTKVGCLAKCSEILRPVLHRREEFSNSEMFCFVFNLFDATQISIFIASWDLMKDDSWIGRAKKISEGDLQAHTVRNSASILGDVLNQWFSCVGDSYSCACPTRQRTPKRAH